MIGDAAANSGNHRRLNSCVAERRAHMCLTQRELGSRHDRHWPSVPIRNCFLTTKFGGSTG
jgi:hypothetical protein